MPGLLAPGPESRIDALIEQGLFSHVDFFFAGRMFRDLCFCELSALAYLLAQIRRGRLFVNVDESHLYPVLGAELKEGFGKLKAREDSRLSFVADRLYLKRSRLLEEGLFKAFANLAEKIPPPFCGPSLYLGKIDEYEKAKKLDLGQAQALRAVIDQRVVVISGGPGSGKSHAAAMLCEIVESCCPSDFKIIAAAPTGKAAYQLAKKASGRVKAMTLHALLGLSSKRETLPENVYIDAGLVIVDEASMVDAEMMLLLFSALPENTRLVLIGDPDQLPPIEPGALFHDLVKQKNAFLLEGQKRFRGSLSSLSLAIAKKELNEAFEIIERDFEFVELKQKTSIFKRDFLARFAPKFSHFTEPNSDILKEENSFCILTPLRQGAFGSEAINSLFLTHFKSLDSPFLIYPVIVAKNDYDLGLFTGQLGIRRVNRTSLEQNFYFESDGEIKNFSFIKFFEPAFALSVHKSQGSEFNEVALMIPQGGEIFGREMIYTAITRAREKLTFFGSKEVLKCCLNKSLF